MWTSSYIPPLQIVRNVPPLFCPAVCLTDSASTLYKKLAIFPSPAGMTLTRLSVARNNEIISGQGEFG
jgi:hypothetical protein